VSQREQIIRTTCPRDCYDSCGVEVHVRDGSITAVRGDPAHYVTHGRLCTKCSIGYNQEWINPKARLSRPLRRTGPKGQGRIEKVSWDIAVAEIADRLKKIIAMSGGRTIFNTHYTGTISSIGYFFPMRFFNRIGATEVAPDTICNMAGHVALQYMYGTSVVGFDPRMGDLARCTIVWGANPAVSAPHTYEHWLMKLPGTVVVVDPIRTKTAEGADIHLQPFPGSDAALVFSLLNVMYREGLIDREFIANHTTGFENVIPSIEQCTPTWGEAKTSVPAHLIEEVARLYAKGPSLLWLGQGLQRQAMGGNVMRACSLLPAATGNIGKPGTGFLYLNYDFKQRGVDTDYLSGVHLAKIPPAAVSQMDLANFLEDSTKTQALFCWNINIAASNPQQARLRKALSREDLLTVVVDLFSTDTADYADYVLPAASFLEFDDLVVSYFNLTLAAQRKAIQPIGEALPNQEIFRRLSRAMDYTEPELYESDSEMIAAMLKGANVEGDFASFANKSYAFVPREPVVQFSDLKFNTPSGRIEISSERAAAAGHLLFPLPLVDPHPKDGWLRLLSPAQAWSSNDSMSNVAKIAKLSGTTKILMHPDDASSRGLVEGEKVEVANETGRITMRLKVSDTVPLGVVLTPKGRWPKLEEGSNVNILNPGQKSDMGESTSVHGVEVTVKRAN